MKKIFLAAVMLLASVTMLASNESAKFQYGNVSEWVESHLHFPAHAEESQVAGSVTVAFYVESDGKVRDVRVISASDDVFVAEVEKVLKSMPAWIPAHLNGRAVRDRFVATFNFVLK